MKLLLFPLNNMKNFIQSLVNIQGELKAPKNQYNSHGKYYYRNCEDILEALKPLLIKEKLLLTITDEIICIDNKDQIITTVISESKYNSFSKKTEESNRVQVDGGARYYVKSTVTVTDGEFTQSVSALAREEQEKKGMAGAQVTGAASSYARKYALNAMFLIDDTKDADSDDNTKVESAKTQPQAPVLPDYISQINAISSEESYKRVSGNIKNNWHFVPPELKETLQQLLIAKKEAIGLY